MDRYNRQTMLPEIGAAGQEKIRRAKVLLVGVGGLGSPIALYLTGAGIGTLGLVDDDVVDRSNLQRQVLYAEDELGLSKAEQARQRLERLNSEVHIQTYPYRLTAENADSLIAPYDLVIDGCDNFATRYLINDACVRLGKIYVYGSIRVFDGQVAVFNHPEHPVNYRTLYPDEEEMLSMPAPPKGVMGVTPGVVGCVEACEALKVITGFGEPLIGKLWTIDLRTMQSNIILL